MAYAFMFQFLFHLSDHILPRKNLILWQSTVIQQFATFSISPTRFSFIHENLNTCLCNVTLLFTENEEIPKKTNENVMIAIYCLMWITWHHECIKFQATWFKFETTMSYLQRDFESFTLRKHLNSICFVCIPPSKKIY